MGHLRINLLWKFLKFVLVLSVIAACAHHNVVSVSREPSNKRESPPNENNEGVVEIDNLSDFSRVVVISDVHGTYDKVLTLLRAGQIINDKNQWIARNALFIITGDSIDKGDKSLEVLSLWISLQKQAESKGGRLVHTLGNHEAELLAWPNKSNKKATEFFKELDRNKISKDEFFDGTTLVPWVEFIRNEPVLLRVGKWFFFHSGFYPDMNWNEFKVKAKEVLSSGDYENNFLIKEISLLESKDWEMDKDKVGDMLKRLNKIGIFGVVFGHQPGAFGVRGKSAVREKGRLIKIDNGMAPKSADGDDNEGSLLVFPNPRELANNERPHVYVINHNGKDKEIDSD